MKLKFVGLLLILGINLTVKTQAIASETSVENVVCSADLSTAIEKIITRENLRRSRWGILIQPLDSPFPLYNLNGEHFFNAASNVKLLTTAAALRHLGSEFRLRTSIYGKGTIPTLTSLRVIGRGDPTLTNSNLENIAQQLKTLGVRRIETLIVEDSYFTSPINPTWEWQDVYGYWGVPVNSVILNENTVTLTLLPQKLGETVLLEWSDPVAALQWRVINTSLTVNADTPYSVEIEGFLGKPFLKIHGDLPIDNPPDSWGLAIADPANYFLESFYRILLAEGIEVTQGIVTTQSDNNPGKELLTLESPSLAELITVINQDSNNLYAEIIWKILEKEENILKENLTELGVNPDSYHLVDGSGLSRHNLVSPEAVVQTLTLMANTPLADIYRNSLAVAGVSGSLDKRLENINLFGKTGGMTGVSSLSGYLQTKNNQTLVISIIVNNSDQSGKIRRQAIDEIILLLNNICQL